MAQSSEVSISVSAPNLFNYLRHRNIFSFLLEIPQPFPNHSTDNIAHTQMLIANNEFYVL